MQDPPLVIFTSMDADSVVCCLRNVEMCVAHRVVWLPPFTRGRRRPPRHFQQNRASLLLHLLTPAPRLTFIIYRTLSFAHFNSLVQNRAASERTSLLIRVALPHNYTRSLESSATFVLVGKSRDISRERIRAGGAHQLAHRAQDACVRYISDMKFK